VACIACVRVDWDRTAIPLRHARHFYRLAVDPSPEYPFGRKGLALDRAWRHLSGPSTDGMLILDGDVAIDPYDHQVMTGCIHDEPASVWTAPARLWPVSTRAGAWHWAHWSLEPGQELEEWAPFFSFCFTYLPRRLIEACQRRGLASWAYPSVDARVSEVARQLHIVARATPGIEVKHLNY
jgi:hypothetical protein